MKHQTPLLIFVEGRNDIEFLARLSRMMNRADPTVPDLIALETRQRIVFVPFGGSDLQTWIGRLAGLGCREFHLYDRDSEPLTASHRENAARVNALPRCRALLTGKRSLENYLHPEAIREVSGLSVEFGDHHDVAEIVAKQRIAENGATVRWQCMSTRGRKRLRNAAKRWLNTAAVDRMTMERLAMRNGLDEIRGWMRSIAQMADARPRL